MRLLTPFALALLALVPVSAQVKKPIARVSGPVAPKDAASTNPAVPRTPDGHADLQGTWDFAQLTPFERPGDFAGKESLSDEEAEELAQRRIETTHKDRRDGGAAADVERAYNDF